MSTLSGARAAGLAVGYLLDAGLGDPRRYHPVAGFGRLAAALERLSYRDRRPAGVLHVVGLVGAAVLAGGALERSADPVRRLLVTAAATWAVLGGRSLRREAGLVARHLDAGDLAAARHRIRNLVGRDPSELGLDDIARAGVESVAENTSDAVVAPLFWGAVAGVPGLLGYRAVNTLDAMIGHRSPRYRRFGWAAARLDDVVNWLPARLAGLLAAASAPAVGGSPAASWAAVCSDARHHPSPNAGVVEAAFAGALEVRLGGTNVYAGHVENRGTLGHGRPVGPAELAPACRLSALVSLEAAVLAVVAAVLLGSRR